LPEQFARDQQFLRIRFMREVVRQLSKGLSEGVSEATLLSRDQLMNLVAPFREYIQFNEQELSLLFRSAVAAEYAVTAWHDAYEVAVPGGAAVIVLNMLARSEMRYSAAHAVGVLGIIEPSARETCMNLALHDDDPAVEAAAVKALDAVAGAEQVAVIKDALQDKALRSRALRVLGELRGNAMFRAGIARQELRRATRLYERTRLALAKETIRNRGDDGLKEGLRTGATAGIVAALFWCILVMWDGREDIVLYLAGAGVLGGVCMAISSVAGRAVARAMAKLSVLDRRPTWLRAVQQRGTLITFVIALFLVATGPFAIGAQGDFVQIAVATTALCLPMFVVMALAVGVAEWALAGASWPNRSTRVLVTACAPSLPWLYAIATGYFVVSVASDFFDEGLHKVVLIIAFCGAWCSIWASATAGALAESMRHLPHSPHALARARRFAGLVPAAALVVVVAVLLRETPLPFWAPVLDVTGLAEAHPTIPPPRDASRSWLDGRWIRVHNGSSETRIVSIVPVGSSTDVPVGSSTEELRVVWPGTHAMWFHNRADAIEARQPYRQIDLIHDKPSPGTYAVMQLDKDPEDEGIWEKRHVLVVQADQALPLQLACRLFLADGTTRCFHLDKGTSCGIDQPYDNTWVSDPRKHYNVRVRSESLNLSCPPVSMFNFTEKQIPRFPAQVERAEAVVIFNDRNNPNFF